MTKKRSLILRLLAAIAGMFLLGGFGSALVTDDWVWLIPGIAGVVLLLWSFPSNEAERAQLRLPWERRLDESLGGRDGSLDRIRCACCGWLTLDSERDPHDCLLCEWSAADNQAGRGPSLTEARENWARHRSAYAPDQRPAWRPDVLTPAEHAARDNLIEAYQAFAASADDRIGLWEDVCEAEDELARAVRLRVGGGVDDSV
jgi:hypothetical protein